MLTSLHPVFVVVVVVVVVVVCLFVFVGGGGEGVRDGGRGKVWGVGGGGEVGAHLYSKLEAFPARFPKAIIIKIMSVSVNMHEEEPLFVQSDSVLRVLLAATQCKCGSETIHCLCHRLK